MVHICIDLGSMNTSVAVVKDGVPEIVKFYDGDVFPTVVYKGAVTKIGCDALKVPDMNPLYLFTNLKGIIGRTFEDKEMDYLKSYISCSVAKGDNNRCMVVALENNEEIIEDPVVFLSYYIRCIIDLVMMKNVVKSIDGLVISYPPFFTDLQRDQIQKAANYTCVPHIELVSDSIAAYLYSGARNNGNYVNVLVVNCGSSYFSVSIIHSGEEGLEVILNDGNSIGGDTFTNVLLLMAINKMGISSQYSSLSRKERYELRQKIENAKIELSSSSSVSVTFNNNTVCLKRDEFENNSLGLVSICCKIVEAAMNDVNEYRPTVLVFSGRGCKLPFLRQAIAGVTKIPVVDNVDNAVALGLACYTMTNQFATNHNHSSCNPFMNNHAVDYGTMAYPATPVLLDFDFRNYDEKFVDNTHYPITTTTPTPTPTPTPTERPDDNDLVKYFISHTGELIKSKVESSYSGPVIPVNVMTPTDEVQRNYSALSVKDRLMYNIGIRIVPPRPYGDMDVLYKRNDPLNKTVSKDYYMTVPNKKFVITLYQGKSLWCREGIRIRQWEMAHDEKHPVEKSNGYKVEINMKNDGSVTLHVRWKDTNEMVRIVSTKDLTKENEGVVSRALNMNMHL